MLNAVSQVAAEGDSLGGIIEAAAVGFPGGFGNPIFENLESRLAYALFAIPGVRGVEFGSGFQATQMLGSQHNDPWVFQENQVKTKTNHHGGVLGGISTGMPILLRVAFKPTASIAKEQKTVDLQEHKTATLQIMGRHDPCITLRAAPVVEAAIALVLLDVILEGGR
ncbi:Chorismate synthase [bioreactor metagenome]|uniref:chorismate synthase n=1 Tax=bioreactor metagenome TaxID=1076179 RepID=A0A645FZ10_9ZZZZ